MFISAPTAKQPALAEQFLNVGFGATCPRLLGLAPTFERSADKRFRDFDDVRSSVSKRQDLTLIGMDQRWGAIHYGLAVRWQCVTEFLPYP